MENHYKTLGVKADADVKEIKRAFRKKAKKLHPDTSGNPDTLAMRKLLAAYKILSDDNRRFEYDSVFHKSSEKSGWDYINYLKECPDDMYCQAKLIFLYLLNSEEAAAVGVWATCGGSSFNMRKYLEREDWMDCTFMLAEELKKEEFYYEAFLILVKILREERKEPYFRHFAIDVEQLLKELVRVRLREAVDDELWIECLSAMLNLGFSSREEAGYLKSIADTLDKAGDKAGARAAYLKAREKDKKIRIPSCRA